MPQTGATRYQKFLKSEKSKTKLKAKKDLPKGTNVTKTNFKVKKIVIKEQLKKHDDTEASSARKLNINQFLSRLNNVNANSRTGGLQGLKDIISRNPDVLDQHLGQLINGITPLLLHIEKPVRNQTLQVLHLMLTYVSAENIDPFYNIMSTYLRSAMTHINNRIQEDSLLFLDMLLLYAPHRVAKDFYQIIPNFLDMISKLRIDSRPGRTLILNLGSGMTSVKWRVKVLFRLQDYLNKFVQHEHVNDSENVATDRTKKFDPWKLNHYPLFNPNYTSVCHLVSFSSRTGQNTSPIDEIDKFMDYIDTLMPLLFETWVEVCPPKISPHNMETVVNEDAALLLRNILEIISLLWTYIKHLNKKTPCSDIQNIFCQTYSKKYAQHFLKTFPFVTNTRLPYRNQRTEFGQVITDPKMITENLEICHLYILLNPNVNITKNKNDIGGILHYIEKIFNQNTQDDNNINDIVLKILHTIFSKVNSWTQTVSVMQALCRRIIWAYFHRPMSSSLKQQIFSLLCTIALNDSLEHFHQIDAFKMWLENLPDILLEDTVNVQTIDILHKFAVQQNSTFNSVVKPKLTKIIENLPNVKIVDAVNDINSYHKLFALLHWIKVWDNDTLNLLETQMLGDAYGNENVKYIIDTLKLKVGDTL